MTRLGTIRGREITKNKDGTTPRVMLQVEMTSPDDIQTVELVTPPGMDVNPIDGSLVYIQTVGESYLIGFAFNDGVHPNMETGEKSIYAIDDTGTIQCFIDLLKTGEVDILGIAASIILLSSGIIEINGNADFAVRYNALETKLQDMLTALNADIASAGGTGNTTLDISGAKVAEVKFS